MLGRLGAEQKDKDSPLLPSIENVTGLEGNGAKNKKVKNMKRQHAPRQTNHERRGS